MAAYINTNVASLNTQRNLSTSQADLNTSIQRLSSGMRVNSAKDDAAGLSIATRMDAQIRGQNTAIRNANDAISLAQTAEGALGKVTEALQRMRELAVQSSNSTNSGEDRTQIDTEFKQLQEEVTRLTNNTKFNGKEVLAGGTMSFQVGADTTDTINVTGKDLTAVSSETSIATTVEFSLNRAANTQLNSDAVAQFTTDSGALSNNGVTQVVNGKAVADTISSNGTSSEADQDIVKTNMETNRIALQAALDVDSTITGALAATAVGGLEQVDTTWSQAAQDAYTAAQTKAKDNAGSQFDAHNAIKQLDKAATEINTQRANFGAVQNRFSSVIGNLQVSTENQSAAKSRIMDADFASETAKMARGQILQQAGTAMLAQANGLPNGVLALLRG